MAKVAKLEKRAQKVEDRAQKFLSPTTRAESTGKLTWTAPMGAKGERLQTKAADLRQRAGALQAAMKPTPTVAKESPQTAAPGGTAPPATQPEPTGQYRPDDVWRGGPVSGSGYGQPGGQPGQPPPWMGGGQYPGAPLQHATPGTEATIAPYYVGGGAQADQFANWNANEYGQIEGRTTNRFADMFSKYVDVANREANRQAGQIGETLGSRGALYSSANLAQQADLRQRTSQDIAAKGAEFQTTLEDQRQKAWQNVMGNQAGLASAEMGARETAMGRGWQDFVRRSDVPPLFATGAGWGASRPGGGTAVTY